ncbi:MAG: phage terminase large subunit [Devosia sp.]
MATTIGERNDYSVGTTWLYNKGGIYLQHVWRGKRTAPNLRSKIVELAMTHSATTVLIEEASLGLAMLQDFWQNTPAGMVKPIGRKPLLDKLDRMHMQSTRFENGDVHLPKEAPWLADYLNELLGFPASRHDDQVDSTSQALAWWFEWKSRAITSFVGPILFRIARPDFLGPSGDW